MPGSPRSRILNVAKELFSTSGYSAVGTREIAEHAGVNESTLFRHFASKRDLLKALMDRHLARVEDAERVNARQIELMDLVDAVDLYANWYAQALTRPWVRLCMAAALAEPDLLPARTSPMHTALAQAVRAEQERGCAIDGDPAHMAGALRVAIAGRAILLCSYPIDDPQNHPDGISTIVALWLRGVTRCATCKRVLACF